MAEKVLEKLKRLSRELADSVRAELDLKDHVIAVNKDLKHLKKCVACYVKEKENISDENEAVSFVKGYYKAKTQENEDQMKFSFASKISD